MSLTKCKAVIKLFSHQTATVLSNPTVLKPCWACYCHTSVTVLHVVWITEVIQTLNSLHFLTLWGKKMWSQAQNVVSDQYIACISVLIIALADCKIHRWTSAGWSLSQFQISSLLCIMLNLFEKRSVIELATMSHGREGKAICPCTIRNFIVFVRMRGQACHWIYVGGKELFTREQEETVKHPQPYSYF